MPERFSNTLLLSGGSCGPYAAAQAGLLPDSMGAHGELVDGRRRYTPPVRTEVESMSGATIDRCLQPHPAPLRHRPA